VIVVFTNGQRRFLVRLVDGFENGEKAKLTSPGFEILEGWELRMTVQYIGSSMKPLIWMEKDRIRGQGLC
jgi:hypothetical protein